MDFSKEANHSPDKRFIVVSIILIIILGFVIYSNSLHGKFIWDDDLLIKDNIYIKSWSNVLKIFAGDMGAGSAVKTGFYRPLQILTYMIDYSIWKLDVLGYHLTNIILHILVALAIYWFMDLIFVDRLVSFLTSALFIIHPIHTEAVSYISGRADPLASLFMLLTFIFYIKQLHSNKAELYILILLSYILALLSRESSLMLPILLLLYHYTFKEKLKIREFLSLVSIAFIYILLRMAVFKSSASNILQSTTAILTTLLQRLPGFFVALTNYLRLILLPFNLHMEYGNKLSNLTDPKAILGMVILFSLLIYTFKTRKTHKLVFFSLSWFIITLLPQSNLYPLNAYMAEHWLYLPSIGFFLILAKGLSWLYQRKGFRTFSLVLVICLLAIYSYLTIGQNNYWKDPIVFYERTLKYAPDSAKIFNNLGNAYKDINKHKEAIAMFKKAIELNPSAVEAYNNLGYVYQQIGKGKEAMALYKKAIETDPTCAKTYNNLGNAYKDINKHEEAIAMFKKAIELNPLAFDTYNNLGNAYSSMGKYAGAMAMYKKTIELNPSAVEAYNNLGNVYLGINRYAEAIASYKKAMQIDPNYTLAHDNLNKLYGKSGDIEEAIASYKKAIKINPNNADLYSNLAAMYAYIGKNKEAIASCQKALEINPNHAATYNNLAVIYLNEKNYSLAIEYCDRAIKLGHPVSANFLKILEPFRKEKLQ
jgi:tetratricopeptide (TPR) repeat protein